MIGVFGASGFIGQHVVDRLQSEGTPFLAFSRSKLTSLGTQSIQCDISSPVSYQPYLADLRSIVLLVSGSTPGSFPDDYAGEIQTNVLPYARFLNAISETGIEHVVYVSSGGTVYGIPETPVIDETHPTRPINTYGCAKLMIENMIGTAAITSNWTYTVLRPSNPVGIGQGRHSGHGLITKAIGAALNGAPLEIWGDGKIVRDYFDVRDLADAICLCLTGISENQIFNIGSGIGVNINEILNIIEIITHKKLEKIYKAARTVDVPLNILDSKKFMRKTNWNCKFSIEDTIEYIISNEFQPKSGPEIS